MKLLDPNIQIEDIEIEINNDQTAYDGITEVWGPSIPVIKVNEYVVNPGEIKSYSFEVGINKLPTFMIVLEDSQYNIRKSLESEYIDLVTVFTGYKEWYHKFQGIIQELSADAGDTIITLQGTLNIKPLFDTYQRSFKQQPIVDILKSICESSNIGLYVIDNDDLNKQINTIQPNTRNSSFINSVVQDYTDNVWCLDLFYFLHVGDIESIKAQEIDTYLLKTGKMSDQPMPIKFSNPPYLDDKNANIDEPEKELDFFKVKYYTISTNIGLSDTNNYQAYNMCGSDGSKKSLFQQKVNTNVGTGSLQTNTFSGFVQNHQNTTDTYKSIINKTINDKTLTLVMEDVLYEITPFMNIDLELFLPLNMDNAEKFGIEPDTENSGKKTIIGYSMFFDMDNAENNPRIMQTINLI